MAIITWSYLQVTINERGKEEVGGEDMNLHVTYLKFTSIFNKLETEKQQLMSENSQRSHLK